VTPRAVRIGLNNKLLAEVTAGLGPGDQVVIRNTATDSKQSSAPTSLPPLGM
jgi:hypothetical protein